VKWVIATRQLTFTPINRIDLADHLALDDLTLNHPIAQGVHAHLFSQITGFPPQIAPRHYSNGQDGHKYQHRKHQCQTNQCCGMKNAATLRNMPGEFVVLYEIFFISSI